MKTFALILSAAVVLASGGCATTSSLDSGLRNPTFEIVGSGVTFTGKFIQPQDAQDILKRHSVPFDRVIYVRVADFGRFGDEKENGGFKEGKVAVRESVRLREARSFMAVLWRGGYHKSVLVTKEQAEAWSGMRGRESAAPRRR